MTACTNKARGAVVAALAGVLALGAVPAVALATGSDVSLQFADPDGVFTDGDVEATFSHGKPEWTATYNSKTMKAAQLKFIKNVPVVLDEMTVTFFDATTGENVTLKVTDKDFTEDYKATYYNRGKDGNPTGDAITGDISAVGKYIVKVEAVGGNYKGGVAYAAFDINATDISDVEIVDDNRFFTYNAESHVDEIAYELDGQELVEGVDYTVEYFAQGHDTGDQWKRDVTDKGEYTAVITGMGNYAGSVTLSDTIQVAALDLDGGKVWVEDMASDSDSEPTAPDAIWINGRRYSEGDAIMSELKMELSYAPKDHMWFQNGGYRYTITKADPNDTNITDSIDVDVYKVDELVTFTYGGAEWPEYTETFVTDPSTKWDSSKVKATALDGTDVPTSKYYVFNEKGEDCEAMGVNWSETPGTYTLVYRIAEADMDGYTYGGVASTTLRVWQNTVNADADAFVAYKGTVVTSINDVYTGDDIVPNIKVSVKSEDKTPLDEGADYKVTYYNEDGIAVKEIVDAGTYTLKVTSDTYKLSGTTEMTITVAPMDLSTVKADAVKPHEWDNVGNVTEYLPWKTDGVTIDGLDLQYKAADGKWYDLDMKLVKVTILDAAGNEVVKIEDEGVYTIKFEARNADAANNYVIPGDITVTCIKDGGTLVGGYGDSTVNHLKFRDVEYTDYFVNAVDYVSDAQLMTGYKFTKLFGADDTLNRGQMAIVLYNMAKGDGMMDENELKYDKTEGYITGFEDVDGNEYYGKAIAWARLAGVVNGYDETHFGPEDPITREEFAAMIMNYEKKFGDYEQADASVLEDFSDAASVSTWATNAMSWAVANGVVNGTAEGTLIPTNDIFRRDAACMVYNYAK